MRIARFVAVLSLLAVCGAQAADPARGRIVFLGDSLTAGPGLQPGEAYPSVIQQYLDELKLPFDTVNAGANGDTTAGALARLEQALTPKPDVLVVAVGGNDARWNLPLEEAQKNLTAILSTAKGRGIDTVLVGLHLPPRFPEELRTKFEAVFPAVAKAQGVPLTECLMHGMARQPGYRLPEGHPNAAGHRMMAQNVWPALEPIVRKLAQVRLARR